ncbi:MAG TPA: hypothetical protein VKP88_07915 [Candidatus Paceibacterota bacterium]|nr:hypothetical protein [Candidatus Paceibacterota bacterium]
MSDDNKKVTLAEGEALMRVHFDDKSPKVAVVRMAGKEFGEQQFKLFESADELCEVIVGKISVLDAIDGPENNDWIPEGGKRVDEHRYWLFLNAEDNAAIGSLD